MIISKVTIGFVTQRYDTEKKRFIDQEFIGSDDRSWENEIGESVVAPQNDNGDEPYLNYEMKPVNDFKKGDKVVATPESDDEFYEFEGTVIGFRDNGNLITVKDQNDDCFDCRPKQLKYV
jgi:hypothetical protein